ncbi:hypothetical protein [Streptomyces paromomycinus]|uniref:Uncharacterized protein n=1 Tax=Streptomyces paromomycinus TaxID=92743 RepID=A0A401W8U7_STREY|nr:hypothetical protein [Streptomyces paromomycinus]GCD45729.1 hypothetical protein GKJPGBOP_05467 [Streptomyces paromomycinus]
MESTITSIIAVLGTLGGALVAGVLHSRSAARTAHAAFVAAAARCINGV